MQTVGKLLLGVACLCAATGRLVADDPKAVIDRAIKAHAGTESQLAKRKVCVSRSRGVLVLPTGDMPTSRESWLVLPDRVKHAGEFTPPGNKVPFIITLNGLKGWRNLGGLQDMTQQEYEVMQDEAHFQWVCTLIPLKERSYTLSELPEIKVNDRPAVGVKVASRSRGTVQLYFDKRDHLLVKGIFSAREGGVEVPREWSFAEYKEFDGIRMPTRQLATIHGKKTEEWTYESYRFPSRIDEKEFAKP